MDHETTGEWQRQQQHLWVGRRGGMPLGTIEQGRRFTAVSTDGVAIGRFTTLAAAQRALLQPASMAGGGEVPARRADLRLAGAATSALVSTAAFGATALVVIAR